jgi:hypothetical protein
VTPAILRLRLAQTVSAFARTGELQRDFRTHGWHDFLAGDIPETADPAEIAAAAVLHLVVGEDERFNGFGAGVVAVDAFLRHVLGNRYPCGRARSEYARLHELLTAARVDHDAVRGWYRTFVADR